MIAPDFLARVVEGSGDDCSQESFPDLLVAADGAPPGFIPELARLELLAFHARKKADDIPSRVEEITINPTVALHECAWRNLWTFFGDEKGPIREPEEGGESLLIWCASRDGETRVVSATGEILLALKFVAENLDPREVSRETGLSLSMIGRVVDAACEKGILLKPATRIRRDAAAVSFPLITDPARYESTFFTLQWHITQACDLHCRHCYDRSRRSPLTRDEGLRVLDDLYSFCREYHVRGQVSFTGGNPLMHPDFFELYSGAAQRGFYTAVLGNPASEEIVGRIVSIQMPAYYQVSLEGLRAHNDYMRGEGHFDRVMNFLDLLKEHAVTSIVMLTLTRDNLAQVLPLAEALRDRADEFMFNRLSRVGEGSSLAVPPAEEYASLLEAYLEASEGNPIMGMKDNLFNILKFERGEDFFGGCAGYGCGAAFNFVALLPDGEVHACRKFPSLIGNIREQSLAAIYESEQAARYRRGSEACRSCQIRPVCGGCPAVVHSSGLDVFKDIDPFCFFDRRKSPATAAFSSIRSSGE